MEVIHKNMNRSLRRHHKERLKNKRKFYWLGHEYPMTEKQLSMVSTTAQVCSSYCCGNRRKWNGELTVQERKHLQEEIIY
jgi:hypothetical protein